MEEENNSADVFGELDWYKAKTVEEMRSDLVLLAQGKYFDNDQDYAAANDNPNNKGPKLGGNEKVSIISGFDLNDQAPEGPGPEEYKDMSDDQIVSVYISRIKRYPPIVEIEDPVAFADAFLPALDNINNVAQYFRTGEGTKESPMGSKVKYDEGMIIASEIQTGSVTDYIDGGFKNTAEFYEWYLRDVANLQPVLQPGQKQAEDFSIVGKGFYDDELTVPNTRFPRKPETTELVPESEPSLPVNPKTEFPYNTYKRPDKFAISQQEQALKPEINPLQKGQEFIDLMADMRRINPKVQRTQVKPERRRLL
jgi:hypothetical protein